MAEASAENVTTAVTNDMSKLSIKQAPAKDPQPNSISNSITCMPLSDIKALVENLPANVAIKVPAHLELPFLLNNIQTTMSKLSVLGHHLRNPNSSYPQVATFDSGDLKIILAGVIRACEVMTANVSSPEVEDKKIDQRHFHYFAYLPVEIRERIWIESLEYEEIVWVKAEQRHTSEAKKQLVTYHNTKKSQLLFVNWEAYRTTIATLIPVSSNRILINLTTDILWWRNFGESEYGNLKPPVFDFGLVGRIAISENTWRSWQYNFLRNYCQFARQGYQEILFLVSDEWQDLSFSKIKFGKPPSLPFLRNLSSKDCFAFSKVDKESAWEDIESIFQGNISAELRKYVERINTKLANQRLGPIERCMVQIRQIQAMEVLQLPVPKITFRGTNYY